MQYEADRRRQFASESARASYRGPGAGSIAAASAAAAILRRMTEGAAQAGSGWEVAHDSQSGEDHSSEVLPDEGTASSSWASDSAQSDW
jgi:hypothetical protein